MWFRKLRDQIDIIGRLEIKLKYGTYDRDQIYSLPLLLSSSNIITLTRVLASYTQALKIYKHMHEKYINIYTRSIRNLSIWNRSISWLRLNVKNLKLYVVCIWILFILLKTENLLLKTLANFFFLLQITVHPFLALGWSMNSAMDRQKKYKETNANATAGNKRTHSVTLFKFLNDMTSYTLSNLNRETYFLCLGFW